MAEQAGTEPPTRWGFGLGVSLHLFGPCTSSSGKLLSRWVGAPMPGAPGLEFKLCFGWLSPPL